MGARPARNRPPPRRPALGRPDPPRGAGLSDARCAHPPRRPPRPGARRLRRGAHGFFVPPGTASGWLGAGVRGCGRGTWIVVPYPGRATGGVRWLIPPDGSGTLTDLALLERAMHEAAARRPRKPGSGGRRVERAARGLDNLIGLDHVVRTPHPEFPPRGGCLWNAPDQPSDCPDFWPPARRPDRRRGPGRHGPGGRRADTDLARNGGFEAGLDGWSCANGSGAAVTTPKRTGTSALRATPAGSDHAKCAQSVTVKPNSTYTLSAWVQGSYVYSARPAPAPPTSPPGPQSPGAWKQLTTTFTTGPSTTSVSVYTHGWYGTPAYYADDVTLIGPGGDPVVIPAVPAGSSRPRPRPPPSRSPGTPSPERAATTSTGAARRSPRSPAPPPP